VNMTDSALRFDNVFGAPPAELALLAPGARQFSPLVPGAEDLGSARGLANLAMLAPPGALERGYVLAQALEALAPGASFVALAPKDKGGARLAKELGDLDCDFEETSKRRHRICHVRSFPTASSTRAAALAAGAPRFAEEIGLWTQPGVFSWNRLDPGSVLLIAHLPKLRGEGADLGCGLGVLSQAVLASPQVERLALIDIDRRAIDMATRNIVDARAHFLWADARGAGLSGLDFVVMNPPFHASGLEDKALGQAFIEAAAAMLRRGGEVFLTANRHLPYEGVMKTLFASIALLADTGGYKIYRAKK